MRKIICLVAMGGLIFGLGLLKNADAVYLGEPTSPAMPVLPPSSYTNPELDTVLGNLRTIGFNSPEIIKIAVSTINQFCTEQGLSLGKVLSVIRNFDEMLRLNSAPSGNPLIQVSSAV